jgi:hypothetical protein
MDETFINNDVIIFKELANVIYLAGEFFTGYIVQRLCARH